MKRIACLSIILMGLSFSFEALAFTCYFTLVKNSCWKNYDVTVELMNASSSKSMVKTTAPKGKDWIRTQFTCEPNQAFNYHATFLPIIWDADKGKVYPGKSTWSLPPQIKKGDTAWNITMCFPEEFAEVPYPLDATGNCKCDNQHLPPVTAPEKP